MIKFFREDKMAWCLSGAVIRFTIESALNKKSNETVYIKLFNLDWESTILNHLESKYLDQQ